MATFRGACCTLSRENLRTHGLILVSRPTDFGSSLDRMGRRHVSAWSKLHESKAATSNRVGFLAPTHSSQLLLSAKTVHTAGRPDRKKDYYDVLGIPKSADAKDIKKAYYKLAKQYHPDVCKDDPNAAKKFQEVSEAYEVLGDAQKRQDYDTFGMSGARAGAQGFPGAQGGFGGFENFRSNVDPEELFRNIFGDAFRMSGFTDVNDFEESKYGFAPASSIFMDLTFEEAARGVNKDVNVNAKETCPRCDGRKAEPGTKAVRCDHCNGTGYETFSNGPFVMRSTCRKCYGKRQVIKVPCIDCHGKGKIILKKKIVVPVPAGVEDGQSVRVPVNEEELFITFRVAKSKIFRREGADVHSDVTISLTQAVLGGTIKIPGIYENILLNIPAGSQSHDRMRLAGKGISRVNSYGYGDHYVHLKIKIPLKLTPEQKALILQFAELEKNVDGTINGVVETKSGGRARDEGEKLTGETISDAPEEESESFLNKLKRKIFG
ncbi:hypothetical protein CHS0354_026256 [Potamilus streckersoni]|uniref:Uncharacterized protein n=1 Tax=Potamilus streckersoni TaxID=2493646 RepID=A0AAE0T6B5_9BIVA|nr:hypothetical protein CHS0354_026256 [Potamilus streckersoni]